MQSRFDWLEEAGGGLLRVTSHISSDVHVERLFDAAYRQEVEDLKYFRA